MASSLLLIFHILSVGSWTFAKATLSVHSSPFGSYSDPTNPTLQILVNKYVLQNSATGFSAEVMEFGAALTHLYVQDAEGSIKDVVLGFDTLEEYLDVGGTNPFFGATVGRTSNRIGNAKFTLDGQEFLLTANDGPHHLHGGFNGYPKRPFRGEILSNSSVALTLLDTDGEEGYPGNVISQVIYSITEDDELVLEYLALSDRSTPVDMTHHSYFNLMGHNTTKDKLSDHKIQILADHYTPVDAELIPTGQVLSTEGTKFDFRSSKDLHSLLSEDDSGYDHNLCLNKNEGDESPQLACIVSTPKLTMKVFTTAPGLQFYSGNFLPIDESLRGKGGTYYTKHGAMCLEARRTNRGIMVSCLLQILD